METIKIRSALRRRNKNTDELSIDQKRKESDKEIKDDHNEGEAEV